MNFFVLGALAFVTLFTSTSQATLNDSLSGKRLIDTGNGQERWVSEREANSLLDKAHLTHRCGGFFDLTDIAKDQKQINAARLPAVESFTLSLKDRVLSQSAFLKTAFSMLDPVRETEIVKTLSAYKNRYYQSSHGVDAANTIAGAFRKLAANRSDVKVETFAHKFKQPSVIVTLAGQGPHANEIVVIGGHEDSINISAIFNANEAVAPGADDNATGVATVLETFRVILETGFKPDRTIMFMTYAGEEKGLLGSQDIANAFKRDGKSVVAVAQFDMTGFDGSGDNVVFMTDFTNPDLTTFAEKLMDTYVGSKWSVDQCGYACSDHASWTRAGYPSIMPFEAKMGQDDQNIHTKNDLMAILDFNHALHFTKLALSFVAELSAQ